MAALMRSVLRCSRLISVQVPGNIQAKRDVRALRRRPVRVIPPGEEEKPQRSQTQNEWTDRRSLTQEKDKWKDRGSLTEGKDKWKDRGSLTEGKDKWKDRGDLTKEDKWKDRGSLTQEDTWKYRGSLTEKDQWKDRGALAKEKDKWKDRGSLTEGKDKWKDRGSLTEGKDQWKDRGALAKEKDKWKDRGSLTQEKDKWKERSSLAHDKDKWKDRGPPTQKEKKQERGPLTQQKGQSSQQGHQPIFEDSPEEMEVPQKPQELKYERARDGDNRLCKVVSIVKSKSFRDRHGQVLLEGQRLLLDALEAGAIVQSLFFNTVDQIKSLPVDKLQQAKLVKVKFSDIKMWSDVVTPQGIMGIFKKPDHVKMKYPEQQLKHTLPLSLICDNIRDPGNLGTILRSAAGAGCNKVLLTKGCVDAWEPKVIRAGMGAHFRLPIITSLDWDTISNYLSEDTKVFVADNSENNHDVMEEEIRSGKAIDYGWISNDPRTAGYIEGEDYYSSGDEGDEEFQDIPKLPIQHYHQQWVRGPSAIVIGGETCGLSIESLLFAANSGGRRLYIPVVPGVDSLNSAMAASILLFEGRRQMQEKSLSPKHG